MFSTPRPMRPTQSRLAIRLLAVTLTAVLTALTPASSTIPTAADKPLLNATVTTLFQPSEELFANPERGMYHMNDKCSENLFNLNTLLGYRSRFHTLVLCVFYLTDLQTSDSIPGPVIQKFSEQAGLVRSAGLKMIVRFAYSLDSKDAPVERVLKHINQLASVLKTNSDVIDSVQSGFVGAYGEGHYSDNFGIPGDVERPALWDKRSRVISRLLAVLPSHLMIQVRTPEMKEKFYSGQWPLTGATAYQGTLVARTGHHNDCFLRNDTDAGTYSHDPQIRMTQRKNLALDSRFVPVGGEICAPPSDGPSRVSCANAEGSSTAPGELVRFHWSYLHNDWHEAELRKLAPCRVSIERRLGYRISLAAISLPLSIKRGTAVKGTIAFRNSGYASPHKLRPVVLVLRGTTVHATFRARITTDIRGWVPGLTMRMPLNFTTPENLPADRYDVLLNLPDRASSLASRGEYAVRLASIGVAWERATGFNRVGSITVTKD